MLSFFHQRVGKGGPDEVFVKIVQMLREDPKGGLLACLALLQVSKNVRARTANALIKSYQKTKLRSDNGVSPKGKTYLVADVVGGDYIKVRGLCQVSTLKLTLPRLRSLTLGERILATLGCTV